MTVPVGLKLEMGIEPTNKSSVPVRFGQGQGSGSGFGDWSFVQVLFCSVQFDSIESVVRVRFCSVLVYQSHKIALRYPSILHFGSTVWWSFTVKRLM